MAKSSFVPVGSKTRREVADLLSEAALDELLRPEQHLPYAGRISEFAPVARVLERASCPLPQERLRIYRLYVRSYMSRLELQARRSAQSAGDPLVYWRWAPRLVWTRVRLEWQGIRYRLGWPVNHAALQGLVAELGDPLR